MRKFLAAVVAIICIILGTYFIGGALIRAAGGVHYGLGWQINGAIGAGIGGMVGGAFHYFIAGKKSVADTNDSENEDEIET